MIQTPTTHTVRSLGYAALAAELRTAPELTQAHPAVTALADAMARMEVHLVAHPEDEPRTDDAPGMWLEYAVLLARAVADPEMGAQPS